MTEPMLLVLLGNRELQIHKDAAYPGRYQEFFSPNRDNEDYFVINTNLKPTSFLDISKKIVDDYDNVFKNVISFPMIDAYLQNKELRKLKKIVLTTSKQHPLDKQDCHYIAELAKMHYEKRGFEVVYLPFACNPTHFGDLVTFFTGLYQGLNTYKIFFGNSGGTPDMRSATYFAGIFQNIEFITLNARTQTANTNNFKKQEQLILKHTVEKMLAVYDYEGINQLPIENPEIKALAQYAQARIALDFRTAKSRIEPFKDTNTFYHTLFSEVNTKMQNKDLERETYFSAKIKYAQGAYSDYLWRLFTIHDNMYIPFVETNLGGEVIYKEKDKHADWNELLNKNTELIAHLKAAISSFGTPLDYQKPNKFVYKEIMNFFVANKGIPKPNFVDDIDKCLLNLGVLRNGVAHNYKGIGVQDLDEALPKKFRQGKFNELLSNYINEKWDDFGIYTKVNDTILILIT